MPLPCVGCHRLSLRELTQTEALTRLRFKCAKMSAEQNGMFVSFGYNYIAPSCSSVIKKTLLTVSLVFSPDPDARVLCTFYFYL